MLLFCDGMDSYSATADILKKWDRMSGASFTFSATGGVNGGGSFVSTGSDELYRDFGKTSVGAGGNIKMSFWFKAASAPASDQEFLKFYNFLGYSSVILSLYIRPNGNISLFGAGGWNGLIASSVNICNNAWRHVEVDVVLSTSNVTNVIRIWVDGTLVGSHTGYTGNNTAYWPLTAVSLRGIGVTYNIDDLVIWDSQNTDGFNSSPLGINYIETLRPTGAGSLTGLTPTGAAANWDAVNDTASDTDTSYVSGTSGVDLYGFGDMVTNPSSIAAVAVSNVVRPDASGTISVRPKALSGASTGNGESYTFGGLYYRLVQSGFANNPATSAAWTKSEINAAEFGVEVL